jgi:HSP20 family protein
MAAERIRRTEKKSLEPYRAAGWMSPFEKMEELFENFFERPFGRPWWPVMPRMERMFEEIEPTPMVDIYEEDDKLVVKCDLPGMTRDDIEINLTDDTITISGEKRKEEKVEKKNYFRLERAYGAFKRSFALPVEVDTDKAKASFKDGVLEVKIPKTEAAKQKGHKIKIE